MIWAKSDNKLSIKTATKLKKELDAKQSRDKIAAESLEQEEKLLLKQLKEKYE